MTDNFNTIKELLSFDSDDEFYFCQIMKRKKEHANLPSNHCVVKTYYLKSISHLDAVMGEMKCLADFHNARVYIHLNKRSFEKTCFHALKKITDQILNKDFISASRAYSSVCGTACSDEDKTWVVDVDSRSETFLNEVMEEIDFLQPSGKKLVAVLPTKNGCHLITKPFVLQMFKVVFPGIDVHKNSPTILYIP